MAPRGGVAPILPLPGRFPLVRPSARRGIRLPDTDINGRAHLSGFLILLLAIAVVVIGMR
jgi:hypothetical protein